MYRPAAVTRRRNPLGAFLLPPSAFFIRFNFPFWRLVFLVAGILQENKGMENGPERKVEGKREEKMRFCVTGATGYIGSWLVNTLLQRGYMVHATLRDPGLSLFFIILLFIYFNLIFWVAKCLENKK